MILQVVSASHHHYSLSLMSENNEPQLDAACRILTVSSSLAGAKVFINRLKALSIESQLSASKSRTSNNADSKLNAETSDENVVPWTIVNRYYIADVHFSAHVIHGLSPMAFDKPHTPPAVIYVWVDGEPYAKHVEELSSLMGGYEPEVSLAVRIPKSDKTVGLVEDNSETQRENNTDIDTILMSYGFEYIDATREVPLRRTGDDGNILPSTDDIPHLPRVLDALSTIMWPSMTSVHKGSAGGGLDSKSKRERDSILEELLAHDDETMLPSPTSHRDSEDENDLMEQMQEVIRGSSDKSNLSEFGASGALKVSEETLINTQLPWPTLDSGKTGDNVFSHIDMSLSLSDLETTSPFGIVELQGTKPMGKFSIGFEDDFTVFVSAPALNHQEGETTPGAMKQQDTFGSLMMPSVIASSTLEPENACVRYQSLGSWSDFGGSDFGDEEPTYKSLDDDDEVDYGDDLPTKEEIRQTSAKIFKTPFTATVTGGSADETGHEESDDVPPFDLSQVMNVLQQLKTDIAGMDNEEERRKAAAKVALGLVYGLEG